MYLYEFARNCIEKLLVFQWALIVLLLLQICFCFVMRETTLVNVYVDLLVFTRIAGTSYTGSGRYWC